MNLGVERASVEFVPGIAELPDLQAAVEGAGYRVEGFNDSGDQERELERLSKVKEIRDLRNRLVLSGSGAILLFLGTFDAFPWVSTFMGERVTILSCFGSWLLRFSSGQGLISTRPV